MAALILSALVINVALDKEIYSKVEASVEMSLGEDGDNSKEDTLEVENKTKYKNIIYTDIENIKEEKLVIFTSERCEFCVEYLDKLCEEYVDKRGGIYLVDMEKEYNKSAWEDLNIKGIPYTILVEDGIVKETYLGLESFKDLP